MSDPELGRQALLEVDTLPAWAAKQGSALTRKEAKFLVGRRLAIKKMTTTYRVMDAHLKNHHKILSVGLDFPRRQTQTLATQIEWLLGWYARSHPAGEWLRAQGFTWWHAGAWIAVVNPARITSPASLLKFLSVKLTYGENRRYRHYMSKVVKSLVSTFYLVMRRDLIFYHKPYVERRRFLAKQSARGEHDFEIPHFREVMKQMTTATAHFEGRCQGMKCDVREILGDDNLVPHLPPWILHTRSRRYSLRIFADHLTTVLMATELGRKFGLRPDMRHYPIPDTHLVRGLNRVQIIKPGEHVSFRRKSPAKAGE